MRIGECGADEAYKLIHRYMSVLFDYRTINRLKERGKRGDNQVVDEIALAAEEREVSGGQNFRQETISIIAGARAAWNYRKLPPPNFKNLGKELYEFANADTDSADNKALR